VFFQCGGVALLDPSGTVIDPRGDAEFEPTNGRAILARADSHAQDILRRECDGAIVKRTYGERRRAAVISSVRLITL